ncbi:MAG: YebC/PmpR family DNA-binding transcriptional regulator, partial [Desulfobulbaceae bacterium]|nr:YebC/PmpR family DNA-binding transcriptional regulator [Desulfobulbaceae bacterium]
HFFSKSGGNLGESGCVAWMFDQKGSFLVDKSVIDEEKLMDIALDAGAEDVIEEENEFQILTEPDGFSAVQEALAANNVETIEAAVSKIPKNVVDVTEEKVARQVLNLLEKLEDYDDVQNVHANFDIPDEIMEQLS